MAVDEEDRGYLMDKSGQAAREGDAGPGDEQGTSGWDEGLAEAERAVP